MLRLPFARVAVASVGVALLGIPAAHAAEGMPQLNFDTPLTLSQVVWGAIIFFVLYYLLKNDALPQVGAVLEDRASRIAADLDAARAAKAQADASAAESAESDHRARAEAQSQVAGALADAKAEAAKASHAAEERLSAQLEQAEGRIEAARSAAMGALRQIATDTTATVVQRLTGQAPDQAALDTAVGNAMQARRAA